MFENRELFFQQFCQKIEDNCKIFEDLGYGDILKSLMIFKSSWDLFKIFEGFFILFNNF